MGSADGSLLACQLVGILFTIGWVLFTMFPFFWLLHYFGYLRADALEEVIGLDVAYRGGIVVNKNVPDDETKNKIDEYMKEYEHRKAEKARLFQTNDNRGGSLLRKSSILGSSLHNDSLHGHSFHGRKIVAANSLDDESKHSQASQRSRARDENKPRDVDVENWAENIRE